MSRQGKVLSKIEFDNLEDAVPDRDICRHREGSLCLFGAPSPPVMPEGVVIVE